MAHEHLGKAKESQRAKVRRIAGNTASYTHPTDKADQRYGNRDYYQNTSLDPLTLPTREKVGP